MRMTKPTSSSTTTEPRFRPSSSEMSSSSTMKAVGDQVSPGDTADHSNINPDYFYASSGLDNTATNKQTTMPLLLFGYSLIYTFIIYSQYEMPFYWFVLHKPMHFNKTKQK